jgi:hypothetical protein
MHLTPIWWYLWLQYMFLFLLYVINKLVCVNLKCRNEVKWSVFSVLKTDTSCRQGKVRFYDRWCSEELLQMTEMNNVWCYHFEWFLSDILFTYLIHYKVKNVIVQGWRNTFLQEFFIILPSKQPWHKIRAKLYAAMWLAAWKTDYQCCHDNHSHWLLKYYLYTISYKII